MTLQALIEAGWRDHGDRPEDVAARIAGALAQSVGPVSNPAGKVVARFYSTWRLEDDGRWRVVFDDGYDVCEPRTA
jgi:hypothetical protein